MTEEERFAIIDKMVEAAGCEGCKTYGGRMCASCIWHECMDIVEDYQKNQEAKE